VPVNIPRPQSPWFLEAILRDVDSELSLHYCYWNNDPRRLITSEIFTIW
jgi:hypothetical protein